MVRAAFGYTITALVVFIFLSLFSCKKLDKDNPVKVYIKAHIPYNNTPIPHVKYTIREYKSKQSGGLGEVEYTDFELSGNTDANGIADISFFRRKNQKYYYDIQFDYSNISVPFQEYSLINAPTYAKVQKSEPNSFEIRILPILSLNYHFKNLNCNDVNDQFKYKVINYDENPNYFLDGQNWNENSVFQGCADYTSSNIQKLSGHYVYFWEAIRGGILTTGIDTFLVAPGINNQINMYW